MKGWKKSGHRGTVAVSLFLVVALLLALVGCGDGGSSTQARAQGYAVADRTITRAGMIKMGDAICRHTDVVQKERLATYQAKHPGEALTAPNEEEKALAYAAVPPVATEIEEVAALGVPKGDAKSVVAILEGWREGLKDLKQKPSLLLGLTEGPFTSPDKLAANLGSRTARRPSRWNREEQIGKHPRS